MEAGTPAVRTQTLGVDRRGDAYWRLQCGRLLAGEPPRPSAVKQSDAELKAKQSQKRGDEK